MKSLSLVKPLALVTVGLPGAGKSFFARQFSETFSAPVVSSDRLRHIIKSSSNTDKSDNEIIEKLAFYQLEELFKTQKTFIIDGFASTRAQRMALRKLAKSKGYDTLLIWVQTDTTTAQYRSMKRSKGREDDKYNTPLTADDFSHLIKSFNPPLPSEPYVVISGKHTYATQARVILKKLVTPRETELKNRTIVGRPGYQDKNEPGRDSMPPSRRNVLIH